MKLEDIEKANDLMLKLREAIVEQQTALDDVVKVVLDYVEFLEVQMKQWRN